MCIRVISPTSLKNSVRASDVVLNVRLPTQTEFCRLVGAPAVAAEPSGSFRFFAGWPSFSCFSRRFWRRCSACERTGTSGPSSPSESSEESLSESESSTSRFRLGAGSGVELLELELEDEEEDILFLGGRWGLKQTNATNGLTNGDGPSGPTQSLTITWPPCISMFRNPAGPRVRPSLIFRPSNGTPAFSAVQAATRSGQTDDFARLLCGIFCVQGQLSHGRFGCAERRVSRGLETYSNGEKKWPQSFVLVVEATDEHTSKFPSCESTHYAIKSQGGLCLCFKFTFYSCCMQAQAERN
jgi:hypothetical protein